MGTASQLVVTGARRFSGRCPHTQARQFRQVMKCTRFCRVPAHLLLPGAACILPSLYRDHSKQLSDTYGVSCACCGQVLEGFGYGRFAQENLDTEPVCIHQAWFRVGDLEEECLYCHKVRPRLDPAH